MDKAIETAAEWHHSGIQFGRLAVNASGSELREVDFAKFLFIARGSAGEVRSMLYLAKDQGYLPDKRFDDALVLAVRVAQLCWGMIKHLQKHSDWKTGSSVPS